MCPICLSQWHPGNSSSEGKRKTVRASENSSYRGKFEWNFDQRKWNLVRVSGEFELSEFELWRFLPPPQLSLYVPRALSIFFLPSLPTTQRGLCGGERSSAVIFITDGVSSLTGHKHMSLFHLWVGHKWNKTPWCFIPHVICGIKSGQIYASAAPF